MYQLDIQDLSISFDSHLVLNGVSWQLEIGKSYALIGVNGAGKTTLLRCICGILHPDKGIITHTNTKAKIGYLPEERGLYKKMKVLDQLVFFARLQGMPVTLAKESAMMWLNTFDLAEKAHKPLHTLSKGNQQKIQFITAIVHRPDILILDEPFSGFDPLVSLKIIEEIKKLQASGCTIIYSTHRMDTVEQLCDALALLHKGTFQLKGTVSAIKQQYFENKYFFELSSMPDLTPNMQAVVMQEGIQLIMQDTLQNVQIQLQKWALEHKVIRFMPLLPSLETIFENVTRQNAHTQSPVT